MAQLLGIDLGTSSVKAALFDANTPMLLSSASEEYPLLCPQPGYAEQNPEDWWNAVVRAVKAALSQTSAVDVKAIGLSGQMHGLVRLRPNLSPVGNAIIWADTRSVEETRFLATFQRASRSVLPGAPAVGFMASTLLWLKHTDPGGLEKIAACLLPKDYIRFRLTGSVGSEHSDASATGLYDIAAQSWAPDIVEVCGLRPDQLPSLSASDEAIGELSREASAILGLREGTPVAAGSADLPAQALGHGITSVGSVLATIGTGGQWMLPVNQPKPDSLQRYYVFRHNVPDCWYTQAAILAGGLSIRWLRDLFRGGGSSIDYAKLSEQAALIEPGADGLLFLPYLAGERSPHRDPNASGTFFGLRLHHSSGHLARAIMEGVGFAMLDCLRLFDLDVTEVVLTGGVTASSVWPQILSDIWGKPLRIPNPSVPYGALGAAILGGIAGGVYRDFDDALSRRVSTDRIIEPQAAEIYRDRYAQFKRLYPLLKEEMQQIQP